MGEPHRIATVERGIQGHAQVVRNAHLVVLERVEAHGALFVQERPDVLFRTGHVLGINLTCQQGQQQKTATKDNNNNNRNNNKKSASMRAQATNT